MIKKIKEIKKSKNQQNNIRSKEETQKEKDK